MERPTQSYDRLAEWFAREAPSLPWNAHYDRPATLALVGDVEGQNVLDLGCGPGLYAEQLLAGGARLTCVDGSDEMVRLARQRLPEGVAVARHDLEHALPFADSTFDGVVMALVVHHVDARRDLYAEIRRVLTPGGWFVMSTHHPVADWVRLGGSYFTVERLVGKFGPEDIAFWRMPMSVLLNECLEAGFVLDRLVEPLPTEDFAEESPESYERLRREPGFIALRFQVRA